MSATEEVRRDAVSIDRATFNELLVELGGLADFADEVYGGSTFESFLHRKLYALRTRMAEAAGIYSEVQPDDVVDAAWCAEGRFSAATLVEYATALNERGGAILKAKHDA